MHILIMVIVTFLVVGVLLWAVNTLPVIDDTMRQIIRVVVVVAAVLWLLSVFFGASGPLHAAMP